MTPPDWGQIHIAKKTSEILKHAFHALTALYTGTGDEKYLGFFKGFVINLIGKAIGSRDYSQRAEQILQTVQGEAGYRDTVRAFVEQEHGKGEGWFIQDVLTIEYSLFGQRLSNYEALQRLASAPSEHHEKITAFSQTTAGYALQCKEPLAPDSQFTARAGDYI
ncbi:hypothetical protein COY95_00040 [Candidatus Woesearchaeota archaeon CG_4_10_14_0_8_um_filter_47_5]|nr:MAG: hypothetical protein COY95_00040 [Candidatus Woesearchaeota archaeon CG_4_10_14_0_8_um_filter_47_5]